ncbi:GNAT family N-acetyltransferase [Calidifontibacter sp. DB0510]|uniref:GNAT family N-acetyltransferase n=1 Tax=Metallococcus carri TaxID=1656884 RepID=A0A967AXV2_9MICO|nr:GNAT family protein [Metallococcus carri]NHN54743.1 GNAT family N-acetyltransferase [Metallococcus carri]NOP37088.1 GNAT family N-acetyltransferase [Calidifontibacter sp. DB2511S]
MTDLAYPDPPLQDGRFGLRAWRPTDLECVRLASTDPQIPLGTTVPAVFTPDAGRDFVARQISRARTGQGLALAIADLTDDRAIGHLWLGRRPQENVAGVGYWVIPSDRRRGAAASALRLIVPWAFASWGVRRIEAWVAPDNLASRHTLLGAGFELEGRLRNFLTVGGQTADALVFSTIDG